MMVSSRASLRVGLPSDTAPCGTHSVFDLRIALLTQVTVIFVAKPKEIHISDYVDNSVWIKGAIASRLTLQRFRKSGKA